MLQTMTDHLKSRHLDLDLHRPVVDDLERVATFYLYNLSGQLVGYQLYRPEGDKKPQNNPKQGKYFTYRKQPTVTVFGVESLHFGGPVFLCEGVFDACRLTSKGASALAVLSNNPTGDLRNFLTCLGRRVVVVADNDKAGRALAKFGHDVVFCEDKDLGDSSEEFVESLLNRFCGSMV